MKVGELLNILSENAGVDKESDTYKMALSASWMSDEIPDEIATQIKKGNLSLEAAKHNKEIRAHFTGNNYGTIDTKLKGVLSGLLSEDQINELFEVEKNTPERLVKAFGAVKDTYASQLEEAKKAATNPKDKAEAQEKIDEYAKHIADLQAQLVATQEGHQSELLRLEQERENREINSLAASMATKYKLPETSGDLLRGAILGEMTKHVVFKKENGELVPYSAHDPNLRFTLDNQMLSAGQVFDHFYGPHVVKNDPAPSGLYTPKTVAPQNMPKGFLRTQNTALEQLQALENK